MDMLKRENAEIMLYQVLKRTLINENDLNVLMEIAKMTDRSIPMKAILYKYSEMEKKELTKEDRDIFDTLIYFYGP
ncbi:hypothetical protein KKI90_04525 [Xenorhabdus bovienii]|uniref:hypothetical protein n=1 Tax=Xenorhabdus bovienii TaxID=40576 RepID=UPI00237C9DD9|nr:hypothetical protein [Xenorhabdus bovienii]MDE1475966.1 hypothetical protein [Xenorhabdus bovienii]MDE1485669.1 hypothetical protein [Xenorhabdus bovienii]MDE9459773.1 hypothetical protein [Xenorhabdus bovienii]MDE9476372.1 hypothetical protein [Xenorhabdus bovienii]MDE9486160.1 hypothetical protein [Xenorhabdus bovienii]